MWAGPFKERAFRVAFLHVRQHRFKRNFNGVRPSLEHWLGIKFPRPKHVVRARQFLAVDSHRGQRVQTFAPQKHPVMRQIGGGHFKRAPISPVRLADPLNRLLIVAIERIGNPARGEQIGVNATGNFCGQSFVAAGGRDLPRAVEAQGLHSHRISPVRKA